MRTAAHAQISSFSLCPPASSNYSVVVWGREETAILVSRRGAGDGVVSTKAWLSASNRGVKRQAGKSCKESSSCVLKPGSALAKVYFCISEHTNPSACLNSLQLSHRQLMTTAQQQHCLISNVFLNLGCQGSLVGGCLLYFSYKKSVFFFSPQTMTNPKDQGGGSTANYSS